MPSIITKITQIAKTSQLPDFTLGKYQLRLDRPHIMGVLNITPDSFYDGGLYLDEDQAIAHAEQMAEEGAAIIDVGAESTRPGALPVDQDKEQEKVLSLVAKLSKRIDIPISIDTSNPTLIENAASAGASLINDVRALSRDGALKAAAQSKLAVCMMHKQGEPADMQNNPRYDDVVYDVMDYLAGRKQAAIDAGIDPGQIILDPGFGFGKNFEHNLALLRHLGKLKELRCPILVGLSRKSFLGQVRTDARREINAKAMDSPADRLAASVAATTIAVMKGAWIIRVHDVKENVDAMKLAQLMLSG